MINLYSLIFLYSKHFIVFTEFESIILIIILGIPKATTLRFYYRLVYYCILVRWWIW